MRLFSYRTLAQAITMTVLAGTFAGTALAATSLPEPGGEVKDQLPQPGAEVENNLPKPPPEKTETKFTVKSVDLMAPELKVNKEALTKILEPALNREVTLEEFNAIIDQLTVYCRRHGYPAAAAYLPAQDSVNGAVTINIIPGRYGKVIIENHSKLKEDIIKGFLNGLKQGTIIRTKGLETALYEISELSGTKAVGVLSPGESFGSSDLTVRVEDGKLSNTVLYTENYGSRSSGRYRYGIQETLYNVGGTGGKLNAGGLISNNHLHNYYLNYETLIGRSGATLGLGISRMDYELGGAAQEFGANGVAKTLSLFGSTPLYHMTDRRLKVTYGLDFRRMNDDYSKYSILDRKKHSEVAHVGIEGSEKQPGSLLNYDATLYVGRHHNDSSSYGGKILDDLSHTQGTFTKLVADVTGVQSLGHRADVMVKLQGQAASRNLDSSEQIYLGGANGVRAYPQGEGSGDKGFLGTAEFRFYTNLPGLVLSAYFDAGHVAGRGDGTLAGETLKGWGLGISYSKPNDWFARFDYARRIGSDPNMSSDARSKQRMWFILGKIW